MTKFFERVPPGKKGVVVAVIVELALAGLIGAGVVHEWRGVNSAINELAELADPSPYRSALVGNLGRIHLALQGFLRSADPSLFEQVSKGSDEFEAALPQFQTQNPRLFPRVAMDEIGRTFGHFKQSVRLTLEANSHRQASRKKLEENFSGILYSLTQNIRPLIRDTQSDATERREAALSVENQARAWQQNLRTAWDAPAPSTPGMSFENDNRGSSYIDQYLRLDLLPRERKVVKSVREIWQENSELARGSFALEKVVLDAETFMRLQRDQVIGAVGKYLPALSPEDLEKQKNSYIFKMRLRGAFAVLLGILGIASIYFFVGAVGHAIRKGSSKISVPIFRQPPMIRMNLKGVITGWSPEAEKLYGHAEEEILGESVALLFESEEDIGRLHKELSWAAQAAFESTHKSKAGTLFRVRIEFHPVTDSAGKVVAIGFSCTRK